VLFLFLWAPGKVRISQWLRALESPPFAKEAARPLGCFLDFKEDRPMGLFHFCRGDCCGLDPLGSPKVISGRQFFASNPGRPGKHRPFPW